MSQRSAGRWPFERRKDTDQGVVAGTLRKRDWASRWWSSGWSGASFFSLSGGGIALLWGGAGGDEETRTPDPLLAKEMLCRLSYVPAAWLGSWWAILDSNQRPLPYQGSALTS